MRNLLIKNVLALFHKPKPKKVKTNHLTKNKFLSDSEVHLLVTCLETKKGERDSMLLRLALYTGARSCEVLAIRKSDLRDASVFVRGAKKSNDRIIHLCESFFNELGQFSLSMSDDELLFKIKTRRFRKIWDMYRPNRNLGLHALRHTFGVKMYNCCADIKAVKTLLGHRSINNTMKYLDFVESQKKLREFTELMWDKELEVA